MISWIKLNGFCVIANCFFITLLRKRLVSKPRVESSKERNVRSLGDTPSLYAAMILQADWPAFALTYSLSASGDFASLVICLLITSLH
jgi:hypothetical protein